MKVYSNSEALLYRALRTIPLGTQTFSKSQLQYPVGAAPLYLERGDGCRVWDVDGNEYLDFVSALLAVTLGYRDPDVDAAVCRQMESGVVFSLPHRLEVEVAEAIVEMVPSAERVRFGKNGSDATAGAIRAARAYTGRDRVAVCGYHGWQDWYIGSTTRNLGVPVLTCGLTHVFGYNDAASLRSVLEAHPQEFAAVILEPMNLVEPAPGFLVEIQRLAHDHGAVLVFDETITGFRFSNGGAQELFGVIPDLTTLGKGLANGYPLSAVAGRAEIMAMFEEVFFSFTMGGETLSLAAGLAVLSKLRREPVINTIQRRGEQLLEGLRTLLHKHGVDQYMGLAGRPCWSFLTIQKAGGYSPLEIKSLWMQEMLARGVLTIGSHNLSYAHSEEDIDLLLQVYDEVLPIVHQAVERGDLMEKLRGRPLQPVFKVR